MSADLVNRCKGRIPSNEALHTSIRRDTRRQVLRVDQLSIEKKDSALEASHCTSS